MTVALALHSSWGKHITYPRVIGPIEGKKEQSVGKFLGWHEMKPPKGNAKITYFKPFFWFTGKKSVSQEECPTWFCLSNDC